MSVYNKNAEILQAIYNADGTAAANGYDVDGTQVFPGEGVLLSFEMFYPNDATSDYQVNEGKNLSLTPDQFLALKYDGYLTSPPAGVTVTKTAIGRDSTNTYNIWEYTFRPVNPKRKILLASGEHAYETTATFGLALFLNHVYVVDDNDAFAYIRNNVEVKVVPIFNPWGWSQTPKTYGVSGGINPERNFNYNGLWEIFTASGDTWNKKGSYPFQTEETKTMARWQMANQDADFFLNCHTDETGSNYDLWIDYMTNTYAVSAILAALDKNKAEFNSRFGRTARVNRVATSYPNSTGYGMHGMWNIRCVMATGFTVEQAAHNTIFGNGKSNSAGGINNYASVLSTYVMEMLLNQYQPIYDEIHPNNTNPIVSASKSNVTLTTSDYSTTVQLDVTPADTTQFTFDWSSSDETVCTVWGCTTEAVIVRRGVGVATITATNRLNNSVVAAFTVTITA